MSCEQLMWSLVHTKTSRFIVIWTLVGKPLQVKGIIIVGGRSIADNDMANPESEGRLVSLALAHSVPF